MASLLMLSSSALLLVDALAQAFGLQVKIGFRLAVLSWVVAPPAAVYFIAGWFTASYRHFRFAITVALVTTGLAAAAVVTGSPPGFLVVSALVVPALWQGRPAFVD